MAESKGPDNDSSLDITVETSTRKRIAIQVNGSDTIFVLKNKIGRKLSIPVEEQALICDGQLLEGDLITLANFGINRGSTLTLAHKSSGFVSIFIKFPDDDDCRCGIRHPPSTLKVKLSDTINSVKAKIQAIIEPSSTVLIFKDTVLDDNSTHSDLDIKKGSTLTVMYKKGVYFKIFVKTPTGETKSVEVESSDTIARVKSMIRPAVDDEDKVLIFNETVLEDKSLVSDFDIKNGSTLALLPKSTGRMQIFVNGRRKNFPLEVKNSDTILYVKAKIHDIEGIPTSEQILMLQGRRLGDCDIHKGDTLDLFKPMIR